MAGVVLNMTRDSASSLGSSIEVTTELYGLSYMQFMGMEPGKGFFLRGDIGRAKVNVHLNKAFEAPYDVSESGTGYLFGVGYAAALSSRSRILFGFNLSKRKVDLGSFKSSQVVVGMLW